MKNTRLTIGLLVAGLTLFTIAVFAQTNALDGTLPTVSIATNGAGAVPGTSVSALPGTLDPATPLPVSTFEFWTYGIAIIVPLLVGGMKKLVPKIPSWVLPVSTPFVGIALGFILKWIGAANMSWVDMGQAGLMAVAIREAWNQTVTKAMKGESNMATKGPDDESNP